MTSEYIQRPTAESACPALCSHGTRSSHSRRRSQIPEFAAAVLPTAPVSLHYAPLNSLQQHTNFSLGRLELRARIRCMYVISILYCGCPVLRIKPQQVAYTPRGRHTHGSRAGPDCLTTRRRQSTWRAARREDSASRFYQMAERVHHRPIVPMRCRGRE